MLIPKPSIGSTIVCRGMMRLKRKRLLRWLLPGWFAEYGFCESSFDGQELQPMMVVAHGNNPMSVWVAYASFGEFAIGEMVLPGIGCARVM